jgi:iron(III) transport system substrate-binding protein
VINAAKKEGGVTLYSSQFQDQLNDFAAKFKAKYGITVTVYRGVDADTNARIQAEKQTGKAFADVWVNASPTLDVPKVAQGGWFVPAKGPNFNSPAYNRSENYQQGDYFVVGAAVVTFGWNTSLYPKGLKDYPDILDPALGGGKIGLQEPASAGTMDWYLYLEDNYGSDFLNRLAIQKPRLYPSALPVGQALTSGEIVAAPGVQPQGDAKKSGAPVNSGVPLKGIWGTRYYGSVLAQAPHPNAAQLLADFMVSPEGQAAVGHNQATVLPNIPGAVTSTDQVRKQDLTRLTPDALKAFQVKWNALFKK